MNLNTKAYWDARFQTRDWTRRGGAIQSREHAQHYIKHLNIPASFSGRICDVGCAEGDAMPVYRAAWPNATLTGVDFAKSAITQAEKKYGDLAKFFNYDFNGTPDSEVIIASHVFEHLENDVEVLQTLINKCRELYVIVPYREDPVAAEHLRTYDESTYSAHGNYSHTVCPAGWHLVGIKKLFEIDFKNIIRPVLGRKIVKMPMQIIFRFSGSLT